ncbi:hypothetical protein EPUS_06587 [Endocarpon pusillum Z07020]|uniref:Major facilitator superfamily (MFS) profile domain-containing protein n=1 Tax=Endocarpon pusillum (strain Z07020 / HMAS-L-300199) TaxID=1263415 RepID=U1HY45_ENDPU|nr:uncharacterized protein EPUS_06587 [Endocarpon pusillum Z07020]ERF74409.1 hypothetical protein EPUS_06587 [Endocarpon pusillum Z07020]
MVTSAPRMEDETILSEIPPETIEDIEKAPEAHHAFCLDQVENHLSCHEPHGALNQSTQIDSAQYERFLERRKMAITAVLSLCGSLAPISSTSILSAVPDVAAEYKTMGASSIWVIFYTS